MDIEKEISGYMSTINAIKDVFEMYYGEENIDSDIDDVYKNSIIPFANGICYTGEPMEYVKSYIEQCVCTIKIHWPSITVSNEIGNSIEIKDLFGIVLIYGNGRLHSLNFVRSTFTKDQISSGYIHSHISSFYTKGEIRSLVNELKRKHSFCFGSGPIQRTLSSLSNANNFSFDPETYILFCRELDICVRVESLAGGPYIKISNVKKKTDQYEAEMADCRKKDVEKGYDFIKYYLGHSNLKYVFVGNRYSIACSFKDFALDATRKYFEYINEKASRVTKNDMMSLLCEAIVKDNYIYTINETANKIVEKLNEEASKNNYEIIKFKGNSYTLKIVDDSATDENNTKMYVLKYGITRYLWNLIDLMINSTIDKDENTTETCPTGDTVHETGNTDNEDERKHYAFLVET
jgi:hypothetical protein